MKENRKTPKRVIFNIPNDWHTIIKIKAAKRNITMTEWIKIAIQKWIDQENSYD